MGALSPILRSVEGGSVGFWCPGCDHMHVIGVAQPASYVWGYNGNPEAPTFTPSVLIRSGHYVRDGQPGNCWCDFEERFGRKAGFSCSVCHSFVTDGSIQFLNDCTHALAGQTVPLPEWEP